MPRKPRKKAARPRGRRRFIGPLRKGYQHISSCIKKELSEEKMEASNNNQNHPDEGCTSTHDNQPSPQGFSGFEEVDDRPFLRVLSVFDGISVGRFCLDELKIIVQTYISSEIDEKALRLQECKFGDTVIPVGDIRQLTAEVLSSLGPIHLLLGGSPCQDFSLVNPRGRGFQGANGSLFWEYVKVLKVLKQLAQDRGHPFFFLFENTKNMRNKILEAISEALECEPVIRDAADYLKMRRERCFWGTIPNMRTCAPSVPQDASFQSILCPNRVSNVPILPTLTTNPSSRLTGKDKILPVLYKNQLVKTYVMEEERAFGLPASYTDGGDLSPAERRRLLGRAWSADVVVDLLRPLAKLFRTHDDSSPL